MSKKRFFQAATIAFLAWLNGKKYIKTASAGTRCKTIANKKLFNKHNLLSVKGKDIIKFATVLIFLMYAVEEAVMLRCGKGSSGCIRSIAVPNSSMRVRG